MIRLRSRFTNNSGATYTIFIYDRDLGSSSSTEFDCGPEFFTMKWEGDRNDPMKRIIPCNVTFTVRTGVYDYTNIQNTDIESFYQDFVTSYEGRFYVRITRGVVLGSIYEVFRGKILPDIGERILDHIGDFTITAIDGITDLKNIEYRPTGYSDLVTEFAIRTTTFKDHMIDILNRMDVTEYFNTFGFGNVSFLTTSANWTESDSVAGDIWNQVRCRNYWFEQKSTTYRKYKSCYDVLVDLLTGFNARMLYSEGHYHAEQIGYQDNPAPVIYGYNLAGNAMSGTYFANKVQHNYDTNDDLQAAKGIRVRSLAALKAVELEQSKQFTNYMNGMQLSVGDISGPFMGNHGPHNFGYIIGSGNKLVTQWNVEILLGTAWSAVSWTSSTTVQWTMRMKVRIGDYYLVADNPIYGGIVSLGPSGKYHVSAGGTIPVLNWTLVDSTITMMWETVINSTNINDFELKVSNFLSYVRNADLVIESNEIQDDGELVVEFIDFVTKRNGTTIGGTPPGSLSLSKRSRIIVGSGYQDLYEQPKGIKRYEVGNVRNSLVYKVSLGYYDADIRAMEQLFLQKSYTIGMDTTYYDQPTVEWTDPDSSDTRPIQELMMKQILAMRAIPTNMYIMQLYYRDDAYISMRDVIVKDDKLHIPIDMEMIMAGPGGYTTWNTVMWEVYKDYLGINVVDTGDPEVEDVPFPLPDGSLDAFGPGGGPGGGLEYYEAYSNVSVDYVLLDSYILDGSINLSDEYSIHTQWWIFINGVRQRYNAGTLAQRQYKFDIANNRIYYWKGPGNTAHMEVFKYYG